MSLNQNWFLPFKAKLGLPASAVADIAHVQTRQPDPGASSYAFVNMALAIYSPTGAGKIIRRTDGGLLPLEGPYDVYLHNAPVQSPGAVEVGTMTLARLLYQQSDAVAHGLITGGFGGG